MTLQGVRHITLVKFTASPANEGNSPLYTWSVNGISCTMTNPVESVPLKISVFPSPVVNLTDKPFLCTGDSVQLDAGPGFTSYLWQDNSTGRYYSANNAGTYQVTVTDSRGCSGSDSVQLKNYDSTLFVPDAFSPNDDGVNDIFKVVSSGDNIPGFSIRIFDRWGALVFESTTTDPLKPGSSLQFCIKSYTLPQYTLILGLFYISVPAQSG